jgi:hypothetical protein
MCNIVYKCFIFLLAPFALARVAPIFIILSVEMLNPQTVWQGVKGQRAILAGLRVLSFTKLGRSLARLVGERHVT